MCGWGIKGAGSKPCFTPHFAGRYHKRDGTRKLRLARRVSLRPRVHAGQCVRAQPVRKRGVSVLFYDRYIVCIRRLPPPEISNYLRSRHRVSALRSLVFGDAGDTGIEGTAATDHPRRSCGFCSSHRGNTGKGGGVTSDVRRQMSGIFGGVMRRVCGCCCTGGVPGLCSLCFFVVH